MGMPNDTPVARATRLRRFRPIPGSLLVILTVAGCAAGPGGTAAAPPLAPAVAAPALPRPTGIFAPSTMTSEEIAPGVAHVELTIPSGPWLVHLVTISPTAREVELRTVKGLGHVVGRERPSEMARHTANAEGRRLLAAVNADFFNFTPPGVSEGPQVSGGRVLKSEDRNRAARADTVLRDQPVFGVAADGRPFFADAHLEGWARVGGDGALTLLRVNRAADNDSLTLYNSFMGDTTPSDSGVVELVVRTLHAAAMAGDTAVGVIASIDTAFPGVRIPGDGMVLVLPARLASGGRGSGAKAGSTHAASRTPAPDDTVRWSLPFSGAPPLVRELVGGYPMLLRDGRHVFENTDAILSGFSVTQHPRTAVATLADGSLLLVAVDGRSEASKGMSLTQLTDFLVSLGAVNALNLDGGGSTVMIVGDSIVNHPSDKEGERAVANALVVLGGELQKDRKQEAGTARRQEAGFRVQERQLPGSRKQEAGTGTPNESSPRKRGSRFGLVNPANMDARLRGNDGDFTGRS
jgi:hypothetical protein